MRRWRTYAWGDCHRCPALTDEPCLDLRVRGRRHMWGGTVHRGRHAFDVTDDLGASVPAFRAPRAEGEQARPNRRDSQPMFRSESGGARDA